MNQKFKKILVVGASRGVGAAVSEHIMPHTKELITVSRSPANFGNWVAADISTHLGIEVVSQAVGNSALDALLYMGGTWETNAFTKEYS
ncbi:MAG: SDR family NAD(P)-dependent oxidoreductase, partial [Cyanobacteria bacterium P01_E01_bin.35]